MDHGFATIYKCEYCMCGTNYTRGYCEHCGSPMNIPKLVTEKTPNQCPRYLGWGSGSVYLTDPVRAVIGDW
jgi:hypothetical protein